MTAVRKSRSSSNWRAVYGGPLVLGALSIAGLLAALLSEGAGRYFSWISVGVSRGESGARPAASASAWRPAEGNEGVPAI
jgi:hypothetical protein